MIRIGADVGGTFTDVVALDDRGGIWTHKVPSTPPHFERAVLTALDQLIPHFSAVDRTVSEVAHGTTVATNAVLEHRGARTALITTRGFRDVLELRRVRAPQLYDLFFDKPRPLVERRLRLEVDERVAADGEVLVALEERELEQLGERLEAEGVEAVAVCLLHAYAFPQHELRLGQYLRERLPEVPVSLSSEVLPERREYERSATTAVNAYVQPVVQRYLGALRHGLEQRGVEAPLLIMQSTGGTGPRLGGGPPTGLCPRIGSRRRSPRCQFRRRPVGIGPGHHPRYGRHHGQGGHDRRGPHRPQPRVRGGRLAVRGQPAHRRRRRVDPGAQHRHRRSGGRRR